MAGRASARPGCNPGRAAAIRLRLRADAWIDVEACAAAVHEVEIALRDGTPGWRWDPALVANAIARGVT